MNINTPAEAIAWLKTVRHFNCASVISIIDAALAREAELTDQLFAQEQVIENLTAQETALREELATLRESYESMRDRKNSIVDLQQRLTVAEQRAAEMEELLRKVIDSGALHLAIPSGEEIEADICAALKPAEECPHNYSNPTGCPVCQGIKP